MTRIGEKSEVYGKSAPIVANIEVTPEMIEAGIDELYGNTRELLGPSHEELGKALVVAFKVMYARLPKSVRGDQ